MEKQRLNYLLEQYFNGKTTEEELAQLSELLKSNTDSEFFTELLAKRMQQQEPAMPADHKPWQNMVKDITSIDKSNSVSLQTPITTPAAKVFPLFKWVAAAAILILFGSGVYFLINRNHSSPAIVSITVMSDSVVSTVRGEQKQIVLPDGSTAWLNSASSISFSKNVDGPERKVTLSGEAFFDVQQSADRPFIVYSGNMVTTVLGTSFNISAYPNQRNRRVAVATGKVKVQAGTKVLAVLEKGRQLKMNTDTADVSNIDISSVAGWRTGSLSYKDETMEDIINDLQRTFNDSVIIKSPELKKVMVTISFDKKNGLQKALDMICRITDVRLSRENGIFVIK